jgi:hypothetical protein
VNENQLLGMFYSVRVRTRTFCVLVHSVFFVRVEYILSVET